MSRSQPHSPLPPSESEQIPPIMTETQRVLPPPTFLGRPEYGYSFRPQLPSLHAYPDQQHSSRHQHEFGRDNVSLPPLHTDYSRSRTSSRPITQAVPISSLLSDAPSDKSSRSDSIVQPPTHATAVQQTHGPAQTGPTFSYQHNSPPYRPQEIHAPIAHHPASAGRPIFSSPFTSHPQPSHSYHSRQSSTCSPTTSTPPNYARFQEPQSATSEQSAAEASCAPTPEPPETELEYSLQMRQQPIAARACGFGERDRRVIDPPPIIELLAKNPVTGETEYETDSYTTLHCVLIDAKTGEDQSQIPASRPDMASAQRLMGNSVASPCVANDEHGVRGSFFVFPDLSCRSPGQYKLLFRLIKIDPLQMLTTTKHKIRARIETDAFEVYTAKEFPGMRASSALLRALRTQGLAVGVKKGSEASRRNARKKAQQRKTGEHHDEGDDNHDDDDDDGGDSEGGSGSDGEEEESENVKPKKGKHKAPQEGEAGPSKGKSRAKRIRSG